MVSPAVFNNHQDIAIASGVNVVTSSNGPANFLLTANKEDVANYARSGNDLILSFKDGRTLQIRDFFLDGAPKHNLVFVQEDGRRLIHQFELQEMGDGLVDAASASGAASASSGSLLGILGAVAAGGVVAAAGGGGSGSGSGSGSTALSRVVIDSVGGHPTGSGDILTGAGEVKINGSGAVANGKLSIFIDGQLVGTTTADANGQWSYAFFGLPDGAHAVAVTQTDSAGKTSEPAAVEVIVDATAPQVPQITSVVDNVDAVTGPMGAGGFTNDSTPTLNGTAEAGSTVKIYDGATLLGEVTVGADGHWQYTLTLPEGKHSLSVTATDAVGNESAHSEKFNFTVDTIAPAAPQITGIDDDKDPVFGSIVNGGSTNDASPFVRGTILDGNKVMLYVNGSPLGFATVNAGVWAYSFESKSLGDGVYKLTATATDAAGNQSAPSAEFTFTVDTIAPAVPQITSDSVTNDTTLAGTAEAGSRVKIYNNGTFLGETSANADGKWSYTPETALTDGPHILTVSATDAAGNSSASSPPFNLMIDTAPPAAPQITSGSIANYPTPTLTGTAEAGSHIKIYNNGTFLGETSADADGKWRLETELPEGPHSLIVTATDAAGNVSSELAYDFTIDFTAPAAPQITSGSITNDTTPTLTGTAEAGSRIEIKDASGNVIGTASTDLDGHWSSELGISLAEGVHSLMATATDAAGNTSEVKNFGVTIDSIAPAAPIVAPTDGSLLTGTAEPGAIVEITFPDGSRVSVTADWDTGKWSFSPMDPGYLGHTVTVTAEDAAGNISPPSTVIVSDLISPSVIDDVGVFKGPIDNGGTTDDSTPEFRGTGEIGSTLMIDLNGITHGFVDVDSNGLWSFTPTLVNGLYSLTVRKIDAEGNFGPESPPFTFTVDTGFAGRMAAPSEGLAEQLLFSAPADGETIDLSQLVAKPGSVAAVDSGAAQEAVDSAVSIARDAAAFGPAPALELSTADLERLLASQQIVV